MIGTHNFHKFVFRVLKKVPYGEIFFEKLGVNTGGRVWLFMI